MAIAKQKLITVLVQTTQLCISFNRICIQTFIILAITSSFLLAKPGDNYRFDRLMQKSGLSQNTVNCMFQDSQGFMWFGTEDGLNRFDGYNFTVYRHDQENTNSLSNSNIWAIFEDSKGVLWIGTEGGGLNRFNRSTETFIHYKKDNGNPYSLSHNYVRSIAEDSEGFLWIGTFGGGLNKFDPSNGRFTAYKNRPEDPISLSDNNIYTIYKDAMGIMWLGTKSGGLNRFDPKTKTFTIYNDSNNSNSSNEGAIYSIYEDKEGFLWIGTLDHGLSMLNKITKQFERFQYSPESSGSLSNNQVKAVFEDSRGHLWIGTFGGGLNLFDRKKRNFSRFENQTSDQDSISNNYIYSILEDAGGNLWIGTAGGGVNKLDPMLNNFSHYRHSEQDLNGLGHNFINSFATDNKGDIWIGSYGGGLNQWQTNANIFKQYLHEDDKPKSISSNIVRPILEDKSGNLWVGTKEGLNKLDRATGSFIQYRHNKNDPKSISHNYVRTILESSDGTLWVGTLGGLNKFDPIKEEFTRYLHRENDPLSLSNDYVYSLYEGRAGNLFVGTFGGGVNILNQTNSNFSHMRYQENGGNSIGSDFVFTILQDSKGRLWIGTTNGLDRFDPSSQKYTRYSVKDGLPNSVVYGILEDKNGLLWMSTNKGISQFNPEEESFTNFDKEDGLQSDEFNGGAYYLSKSGLMYFGGINGFNVFDPDKITQNTYLPPVVITDFLLFNKSVKVGAATESEFMLKNAINYTETIELNYTDYIFAFEFSALNYRQSEKNQFKYMLEGLDTEWMETDYLHRRAIYTNLNHGEYVFKVKGSNDDGFWNETETSIRIVIIPPFWRTWWFTSLIVIITLGLIYSLHLYRTKLLTIKTRMLATKVKEHTIDLYLTNKKLKKEIEEHEMTEANLQKAKEQADVASQSKSDFVANMSHEIRTPMNGVIGVADMLLDENLTENQNQYAMTIKSSGESLLAIINDILDFSKIEAGKLDVEYLELDLSQLLQNFVRTMVFRSEEKGIELICDVSTKVPQFIIGDAGRIVQVLNNLMSNALKFTERGEICLTCRLNTNSFGKGELFFSVKDSGIGISEEHQAKLFSKFVQAEKSTTRRYGGTGLGLAISKQLVELMGGNIGVVSESGQGSTFWFTLALETAYATLDSNYKDESKLVLSDSLKQTLMGMNVLIIDDNISRRGVLEKRSEEWGAQVFTTQTLENIELQIIEAKQSGLTFDIVFIDNNLASISGLSIAHEISSALKPEASKMLLIERNRRAILTKELNDVGITNILYKPILTSELFACLTEEKSKRVEEKNETSILENQAIGDESLVKQFEILLVEDNAVNQMVAKALLRKLGYKVESADHGKEAIEKLKRKSFDLIFMDMEMPVMDGLQTTRVIRQGGNEEFDSSLPIIAMTANAMKGDRDDCIAAGMNDYITKPINKMALVKVLKKWLAKS